MNHISANAIETAARRIDPVFLDTPLLRETSLDRELGVELLLKIETLNPIRSFKGRGTDLYVADIGAVPALVCASAGNFGQGLARAARRKSIAVVVFAATNANPMKIEAMRRFGAEVRLTGDDFDAAKAAARAHAKALGAPFVEDGAEPSIAIGAGTIAREITMANADANLDAMLIPLGNGALAIGMGVWFKHAAPAVEVVGVVAAGAPAMQLSFDAGRAVATKTIATIADGIAVREPVPYAVQRMPGTLDAVTAVDEPTILRAMRLVHEHLGLVVEPAGVVGVAALLAEPARWHGRRIATVLCGGNLTPEQMTRWLG
jgi:threonine dehydratase